MFKKNSYKLDKKYLNIPQKKFFKILVFLGKVCYRSVKSNKNLLASLTLVCIFLMAISTHNYSWIIQL
ncbi:MAG: hypothetical protein DWQ51_07255 [Microcystis wesenbergii TW10]|uniref:Uncharacterized protein n=1 Tax=Microcystis wesenbergii TW10 TaxID=2060474 RepID=A0A3E0M362_9CHRO|nr:MAG: hypothetical protein DWQ51_07255 [Microcystis wesenbergii TW10]